MPDTADARDGSAYFIYHSIGQYPGKAEAMARALGDFAQSWGSCNDEQWGYALGARQRYIDLWSALIGAPAGSLTATENVTTALSSLIGGLPDEVLRGKRVLIAADCFPSLHFLLSGLADQHGFTLHTVPLRDGEFWVHDEDFIDAWGADVGLALLTWVSSTSSHRVDLETLIAHGRAMGTMIGVDVTQAVGLFDYDLATIDADFTISTSLKWLCGSPGAGILQVKPEWIDQCAPTLRGWFSQDDIFSWDITRFSYAGDIRRFDNGTPSIVACAATVPALEWHAAQDMRRLRDHNLALSATLIEAMDRLGIKLATPRSAEKRGGSIMVQLPDAVAPSELLTQLRSRSVYADARGQILRMSPGEVTTDEGVGQLISCLEEVLAETA